MISAAWNTGPHDIRADLQRMKELALANTGYRPEPPPVCLSLDQFQWGLDRGLITPDGQLTEKDGKEMNAYIDRMLAQAARSEGDDE